MARRATRRTVVRQAGSPPAKAGFLFQPRPRFVRSDVRDILTLTIRPPLALGIGYPSRFAPAASLPGALQICRSASMTSALPRRKLACLLLCCSWSFLRASGLGAVVLQARFRQGAQKAGPSQAPPPPP